MLLYFASSSARHQHHHAKARAFDRRSMPPCRFLTNRIIPTAHTLPPSALVQTLSAYAQLQYAPPEAVPHLVHLLLQPAAEGASANGVGTVQVYPIGSSSQAHLLATHGSQSQSQPQQTQGSHGSHERMTHGSRDVLAACNGGELAELAWALAKLQVCPEIHHLSNSFQQHCRHNVSALDNALRRMAVTTLS